MRTLGLAILRNGLRSKMYDVLVPMKLRNITGDKIRIRKIG